jgi:hypothetical protein
MLHLAAFEQIPQMSKTYQLLSLRQKILHIGNEDADTSRIFFDKNAWNADDRIRIANSLKSTFGRYIYLCKRKELLHCRKNSETHAVYLVFFLLPQFTLPLTALAEF